MVKPDHLASTRVLEKAGFVRTGERVAYGDTLAVYEATRRAGPSDLP